MNKLVAVSYSPLFTGLAAERSKYDQLFRQVFHGHLSTLVILFFYTAFVVVKAVDKSVCNRWKDRRR